jgi:hypothetical protein
VGQKVIQGRLKTSIASQILTPTGAHRNDNYEGDQYNGHAHAHHRRANNIDEWPVQEEGTPRGQPGKELLIKDFDDYNF